MANIASSKKDARRSAVRATRNRAVRSAVKTKINRLRRALSDRGGEALGQAEQAALNALSALDRAAAKGVLHRNNTARRKSRLMKRLNAAASEAPAAPAAPVSAQGRRSSRTASSRKSGRQ